MDENRYLRALLVSGALAFGAAGCMIPTYHQPQGFSSTYYRHLQQTAPDIAAPPVHPAELAANAKKSEPSAPPPENAAKRGDDEPAAEKSGSWWSWIRRPLTFGSDEPTEANPDDSDAD